jgi:heptose I phosphotransferase
MLYLNEEFKKDIQGADPFSYLCSVQGKVYRDVKGRRTIQFQLNDKSYFVKFHFGVGWREIIKNILQLRMPILGAQNEWQAIRKLKALGIDTMTFVAYGSRGWNPARRQSFIVTEDLSDTTSLEDYCREWRQTPPNFSKKLRLIHRVASMSRSLHREGVCHRDFYLCHFLLANSSLDQENDDALTLSLIDLHRALISKNLNKRWIVKDVGSLYYSAMNIGLTQRDFFRFMKLYEDRSLRDCLVEKRRFWHAVQKRALSLYNNLGPVE